MSDKVLRNSGKINSDSFPSWPMWGEKEERNLLSALDAGEWGTLGAQAVGFAKRFAEYLGVKHAIALNTGTQALEIMLRGAGIGRGDEVIVPPYTFAATVSTVAYVGAMPVFADVDIDTGCIKAEDIDKRITSRTKAILCVHIGGRPCDMDALKQLAEKHHLYLLEDAAHAHGSAWKGQRCGSLGHAAAFSFQSSKAITGGEGGLIATNDDRIFSRCWHYHNSGRSLEGTGELLGGTVLMGTNGRMAEWEAAVLDAQLDRLDEQCALRSANAEYLSQGLKDIPGVILPAPDKRVTVWNGYMYTFRWISEALGRDALVQKLREENVPCSAGYPLLYKMGFLTDPTFEKSTGRVFKRQEKLPCAESISDTSIWFPSRVLLADHETLDRIILAMHQVTR